ncbi:hypothetical protein NEOKW01_0772 [Nematocida sp. AWRm80]|nr:hypothetical protein NEOKW01_0772 [Nematocida sp. AWRm80]
MENSRPIKVSKREDILRSANVIDPRNLQRLDREEKREESEESEETEESVFVSSEEDKYKEKNKPMYNKIQLIVSGGLILYSIVLYLLYRSQREKIEKIGYRNLLVTTELEQLKKSIYKKKEDLDVANYLEGAKIINELTTQPLRTQKSAWSLFRPRTDESHSSALAIDPVCIKGHCYSFEGSKGQIGIRFNDERTIKSIGIFHPELPHRESAIHQFSVYCIVMEREVLVGEYEYKLNEYPLQKYPITPIVCSGIVLKVHSNHGNKRFTCIYKIYAFE